MIDNIMNNLTVGEYLEYRNIFDNSDILYYVEEGVVKIELPTKK